MRSSPTQQSRKDAASDSHALDDQQALLIRMLSRNVGSPVSFVELSGAGIEFPASVVSELELAGIPLERCLLQNGGPPHRGVRLRRPLAEPDLDAAPAPRSPANVGRPFARRSGSSASARGRWIVRVAVGAMAAIIAAALLGSPAARAPRRGTAIHRAHVGPVEGTPSSRTPAESSDVPVAASPVAASHYEARGHELLADGDAAAAVPELRRAVAATGETTARCIEPAGEACLTYAWALYDLGRALALDGRAASAVPVLESRMLIDDEREIVSATLAEARELAG